MIFGRSQRLLRGEHEETAVADTDVRQIMVVDDRRLADGVVQRKIERNCLRTIQRCFRCESVGRFRVDSVAIVERSETVERRRACGKKKRS